jgi:hypothetical protein
LRGSDSLSKGNFNVKKFFTYPLIMMEVLLEELREFNPYHSIFTDNDRAIDFMRKYLLILPSIPCLNVPCMGVMNIQNIASYSEGKGYRCNKKNIEELVH